MSLASFSATAVASGSSPATGMYARRDPNRGSCMFSSPVVLNAFTTRAFFASDATCSAPDVVCAWVSENPGPTGLVTSIKGRPAKSPAARNASSTAFQGVTSTATSEARTASGTRAVVAPACGATASSLRLA